MAMPKEASRYWRVASNLNGSNDGFCTRMREWYPNYFVKEYKYLQRYVYKLRSMGRTHGHCEIQEAANVEAYVDILISDIFF